MGVDFCLRHKRRKVPNGDIALPEIEARFAQTEYPRFLSRLANDAGIGKVWGDYLEAVNAFMSAHLGQVFGDCDPTRPSRLGKNEWRRAKKSLEQNIKEAHKAIEHLSDKESLAELLLTPVDSGQLDAEACQRIGPRMRSIAEHWEAAPSGKFGWRERALEIADAMEIAAEHPDVVFEILA